MDRRQRWLADLALAGITFIWGATFVVVKEALESSSTLLFLALRFSLAAVVLALLFRRRLERPGRAELGAGVAVGIALFLGYLFQTLGLRLTTPAKSAFITGLSVVLVPVLGAVAYRSRPSWNALVGVACGTVGLYWLVAPAGAWRISAGDWLTLLCAVSFGLHILLLGRFSRRVGVAMLSVIQVGVAAMLALGELLVGGGTLCPLDRHARRRRGGLRPAGDGACLFRPNLGPAVYLSDPHRSAPYVGTCVRLGHVLLGDGRIATTY